MLPGPPLILFRLQAPNGCAHLRHPDTSFLRLRFSAQAPRAILTPWLPVAVLRWGNRQPEAREVRQALLSVDAQHSPTAPDRQTGVSVVSRNFGLHSAHPRGAGLLRNASDCYPIRLATRAGEEARQKVSMFPCIGWKPGNFRAALHGLL
jgi:hypothetical protein